jgi:hypothetical protein
LALTKDACRLIVHIGKNGYSKRIAVLDATATLETKADGAIKEIEDEFNNYINHLEMVLKKSLENLPKEDDDSDLIIYYCKFRQADDRRNGRTTSEDIKSKAAKMPPSIMYIAGGSPRRRSLVSTQRNSLTSRVSSAPIVTKSVRCIKRDGRGEAGGRQRLERTNLLRKAFREMGRAGPERCGR